MSGGPAFLRPVEELTTRLCYVNFDGDDALNKSREMGLAEPIGEEFLKAYCNPAYDGIQVRNFGVFSDQLGYCSRPHISRFL